MLQRLSVLFGIRVVSCLNCQLIHTVQHAVYVCQSTVRYLNEADAVLYIAGAFLQSTDLLAHFFRNT